jgi:hypothetical protein
MTKMKQTAKTMLVIITSILPFNLSAATPNMFVPMQPCIGCTIEISDHTGIAQTAKNAVYRVNNPVTPNGTPPFLELYNPTLATIQNCAAMVSSVQGPTPFSVQLKASEYTLAGSNQVVFLIDRCRRVQLAPPMPGANAPKMGGPRPGPQRGMPPVRPGQGPKMGQQPGVGPRPGMDGRPKIGGGMGPGAGNNCGSGNAPASTSCSTSGGGWQEVTNVLSEDDCQLGYTDASEGPGQEVLYDNDYSVTCTGGTHKPAVFVSNARSNSNWGAYVQPSETCQMKTGPSPTGSGRVVEKIVCP